MGEIFHLKIGFWPLFCRKSEENEILTPFFDEFQKSKTVRPLGSKHSRASWFYFFEIHQKMGEIFHLLDMSDFGLFLGDRGPERLNHHKSTKSRRFVSDVD